MKPFRIFPGYPEKTEPESPISAKNRTHEGATKSCGARFGNSFPAVPLPAPHKGFLIYHCSRTELFHQEVCSIMLHYSGLIWKQPLGLHPRQSGRLGGKSSTCPWDNRILASQSSDPLRILKMEPSMSSFSFPREKRAERKKRKQHSFSSSLEMVKFLFICFWGLQIRWQF